MNRGRGDDGFLLAETLITFAISALVLVGLVSSAAVLLRATDRSVATLDAADDLGRTLSALRRDISGLKRARWNGEEPQAFVFRGGPNSLFFALEAPTGDGARDLRVVALREIKAGGGTSLTRAETHLSALATGWKDLHFGPQGTVPTGPARLRFHYVAEAGPDGRAPRPVDSWPSGPNLPAAVIVEAVEPVSTRLIVTDRIAIRADGDIGCSDRSRRERAPGAPGTPGQAPAAPPGTAAPQVQAQTPTQPQTQAAAGVAPVFDVNADVANRNEFCGRADKGLPPRKATPAAPTTASASDNGGLVFGGVR